VETKGVDEALVNINEESPFISTFNQMYLFIYLDNLTLYMFLKFDILLKNILFIEPNYIYLSYF
jgi:hypothetical protein